jgi:NADH-quinone oxidoreductase subunit N
MEPTSASMDLGTLLPALPEIVVLAMGCLILVVDVFLGDGRHRFAQIATQVTLLLAALATLFVLAGYGGGPVYTFNDMFVADGMAHVLKLFAYIAVSVCLICSRGYLAERDLLRGEFFVLVLFSLLGIMVLISANSLLTLYIGLELNALAFYGLIAFNRDSPLASEAAMKYFILAALASGLLLYGMSMLYGATGAILIPEISESIGRGEANKVLLVFALVFLVAGIGFKFGAVPFHMWIPDVYDGAPTAVTILISSAPKLAAFALAIRILVNGMVPLAGDWQQMLVVLTVLSLVVGNVVGIAQTSFKRMLGYSAISHMGFVLLGLSSGVVAGNLYSAVDAYGAAMFYAIVYVLMATGSFAMVLLLSRAGFEGDKLDDLRGLNRRSPWLAFMGLIIMFTMAGVPPTVGFYAKLGVIKAAISAGQVWLAVVAVMSALIGAFYYLRVVKLMYFDEPVGAEPLRRDLDLRLVYSLNGLALLALGLLPGGLLDICLQAVRSLTV